MKTSEMRQLPPADIRSEVAKRRKKLFEYRFKSGQEEKQRAGEIRALRSEIARLLTVQRERELALDRKGEGHGHGR
jgi:large subunit ribosomal protein L29